MKTFLMKTADVQRKWWLVNADGLVLVPRLFPQLLQEKNQVTPSSVLYY